MNKFENKIKILIHSVILLVLIISVLFIYFVIRNIYNNDFLLKTTEFAKQYNQRSDYFFEALEKNAESIVLDDNIINAVKNGDYDPEINTILNNVAKSNTKILGITVYGSKSTYATDSVIGSNPDKNEIILNFIPENFMDSDENKVWKLRKHETYIGYYRRQRYADKDAIYTLIQKIYDYENKCTGFLLLDIDYKEIFNLYPSKNDFLGDINLYMNIEGEYLPSEKNSFAGFNKNKMIIAEHKLPNSTNLFIIGAPKSNLYTNMKIVMFIIIFIAAAAYFICFLYSKHIVNTIIVPMIKLREKISNYNNGDKQ